MTPDDFPLPDDDAIARAARDGLRRLAGSHAPLSLDWDGVETGARRVRQRRLAAVVAACAIVLATAGAAYAGADHYRGRVEIAGQGGSTPTSTTTTTEPGSTTTSTTSTTAPHVPGSGPAAPGGDPPPADAAAPAVPVQAGDLTGTIILPAGPLVAGEHTSISLTLRNISDHAVSITPSWDVSVGLWVDYLNSASLIDVSPLPALLPGEERTLVYPFTPRGELVGTAPMRAAVLLRPMRTLQDVPTAFIDGVPPVDLTVIPPGWTPEQGLDPGMGHWNVVMSADATDVAAGASVTVHASVTNTGDQPQPTEAYGALAFVCDGWGEGNGFAFDDARLGSGTLAPGETRLFSFDYKPARAGRGEIQCWLGITFPDSDYLSVPHNGLVTDTVTINVLPAESASTTTTTAPATIP